MHKGTKLIQYVGKSDKLLHGKHYTYAELAMVAGVSAGAMRNRIRKSNIIDDHQIFVTRQKNPERKRYISLTSTLETTEEKMSDKWLRRKL
jgi:hypothetical protein